MPELIIEVKHGGLGDHLFLSHIPRVAKESGRFDRVYYSTRSILRSADIFNLVWKENPYVDGAVSAPGTPQRRVPKIANANILDWAMLSYGLDDEKRFHEPEIFAKIAVKAEYCDFSVYDPNYVSFVGAVDRDRLTEHVMKACPQPLVQLKKRVKSFPLTKDTPEIQTLDLLDYCSLIVSCKAFFCLTSGSATLAAALGKPSVAFYGFGQNAIFHHSSIHHYIGTSSASIGNAIEVVTERVKRRLCGQR